jgi:hypothetical protein
MRLFFFTLSCLALILLTSCQKEASFEPLNGSTTGTVSGSFKAKINGVQWVANKASGAARYSGYINITGMSNDNKMLTITLTDSGVHRYILSDVTMNVLAFTDSADANGLSYSSNGSSNPAQAGGEVNITSINEAKKTISGTFSVKVFRDPDSKQKTITEGSFTDVSYATSLPSASTSDTFRVKIDGASWTPQAIMATQVNGQLAINGTNSTATKTVGLLLPGDIKPGTYTLDLWGFTYLAIYNPDSDPTHSKAAVSGTLTVLEHNTSTKRIRGSFSFRAEELTNANNFANITDGYFSVKYQ